MSEPKLYKHNETGEVVAAYKSINNETSSFNILHSGYFENLYTQIFEDNYTPLPEAPEVGSTAWAAAMMGQGHKVRLPSYNDRKYIHIVDGEYITDRGYLTHLPNSNEWQLYEEPKPIVEKLPHEFVEGEEVLVRRKDDEVHDKWERRHFKVYRHYNMSPFYIEYNSSYDYCLPYAGNEHLEGTVTDGNHGAVPKGYVPPHVPKLGDDDYWCVGDEVVHMATGEEGQVLSIKNNGVYVNFFNEKIQFDYDGKLLINQLRILYHKRSYVKEDGTVHEHVPTRPHRIDKELKNDE